MYEYDFLSGQLIYASGSNKVFEQFLSGWLIWASISAEDYEPFEKHCRVSKH